MAVMKAVFPHEICLVNDSRPWVHRTKIQFCSNRSRLWRVLSTSVICCDSTLKKGKHFTEVDSDFMEFRMVTKIKGIDKS